LSGYWKAELDVLGCRWDELDPSLTWPVESAQLSPRDTDSGSFADMLASYETMTAVA
jgi:dTDP-4-dehydrorhamnose 3,5-epimerase